MTITASFGAVQLRRGPPGFGDLLLFGIGASLVFALVESIEFALAEWVQERRGKACDTDPVDRRD